MSRRVPCKFFAQGSCLKGEHCGYSHDRSSPSNRVCTFYQKGACSYGGRCRYEHVKASRSPTSDASSSLDRSVPVQRHSGTGVIIAGSTPGATAEHSNGPSCPSIRRPSGKTPGQFDPTYQLICSAAVVGVCPRGEKCDQLHGDLCPTCEKHCLHPFRLEERRKHIESCQKKQRQLETLRHSEEIECNVCFELVLSKPVRAERKFGILSECDHTFCISCIRNWRSSSPASGSDANLAHRACPICRKLSHFVIPSVIWYSSEEEKQEIVNSYKEKLRSIDCKHFKFGNGNCPFGSSCFYKHTVKPGSLMWNGTLNPGLYRSRFPDPGEYEYEDEDEDEFEDEDEEEDEDESDSFTSVIALQALMWEAAAHPDLYGPIIADVVDPFGRGVVDTILPGVFEADSTADTSDINGVGVLYNHLYSPHVPIHNELLEDDENGEELDDLMRDLMFWSMLQEHEESYCSD